MYVCPSKCPTSVSHSVKTWQDRNQPIDMSGRCWIWLGWRGFEPPHGGTKNRCLTAWLHPNEPARLARQKPYGGTTLTGKDPARGRALFSGLCASVQVAINLTGSSFRAKSPPTPSGGVTALDARVAHAACLTPDTVTLRLCSPVASHRANPRPADATAGPQVRRRPGTPRIARSQLQ